MAASTHEACCSDPTYVQAWAAAAGARQLMRSDPSFIDRLAPPHFGIFQGYTSGLLDFGERELGGDDPDAVAATQRLHKRAASWIRKAMTDPAGLPLGGAPQHPLRLKDEPPDSFGARPTTGLDIRVLGPSFFDNAQQGITLCEPFGGLCVWLEIVLSDGIPVRRYLYSDISPACQRVAKHRKAQLTGLYPSLFSLDAAGGMFGIPHNVRQITTQHLVDAGALDAGQWLVVAGCAST